MSTPTVLLSFDVEEFDMPTEYGQAIAEEEQMAVGYEGLDVVMNIIERYPIELSFFTTANFADHYPDAIRSISNRHEIASHTYYHARFATEDLLSSRQALERITGKRVTGLRMPRMRPVAMQDVIGAGYQYDSSINPTWLPGRYDNRHLSRLPYKEEGMLRIPASVSPKFRIPLFWLSFKNFPYSFYRQQVKKVLEHDGYVCLYLHPWEFINLDAYGIPKYTKRHAGTSLQKRLKQFVEDFSPIAEFTSMQRFVESNQLLATV